MVCNLTTYDVYAILFAKMAQCRKAESIIKYMKVIEKYIMIAGKWVTVVACGGEIDNTEHNQVDVYIAIDDILIDNKSRWSPQKDSTDFEFHRECLNRLLYYIHKYGVFTRNIKHCSPEIKVYVIGNVKFTLMRNIDAFITYGDKLFNMKERTRIKLENDRNRSGRPSHPTCFCNSQAKTEDRDNLVVWFEKNKTRQCIKYALELPNRDMDIIEMFAKSRTTQCWKEIDYYFDQKTKYKDARMLQMIKKFFDREDAFEMVRSGNLFTPVPFKESDTNKTQTKLVSPLFLGD